MKALVFFVLAVSMLPIQVANAAKESGSAKIISKLQLMVQDITAERDRLKTENGKVATELEQAKKQLEQEKKTSASLVGDVNKVKEELTVQSANSTELRGRLDSTTAKLREVVDKYNTLVKSKNELAAEHNGLKNTQQFTSSELKACEAKNVKMHEAAKEIIAGYKNCQNKGIIDTLFDSEPVLQINNVEFETLIQSLEDKINKEKFVGSAEIKK